MALPPPKPHPGYHKCSSAPTGGFTATGGIFESGVMGWRFQEITAVGGSMAGTKLYVVWEITGPYQELYWYPNSVSCAGAGASGKKAKIIELQKALNDNGYSVSTDGVFGPNTCAAAYDYQSTVVGVSSQNLGGDFFLALGLPSSYAVYLGHDCSPWWGGDLPDVPKDETVVIVPGPVIPPVIPPEPAPVASNSKKILAAVLGAVGGAMLGLGIKTKWYPRRSAWAAAGAGGVAGLATGLIVGAVALKEEGGGMAVSGIGAVSSVYEALAVAQKLGYGSQQVYSTSGGCKSKAVKLGIKCTELIHRIENGQVYSKHQMQWCISEAQRLSRKCFRRSSGRSRGRIGYIDAQKGRPPQGLGYIPQVVQHAWGQRGSVGTFAADGSRKYW